MRLRRYQREMWRRAHEYRVSIAVMSRRVGKSTILALLATMIALRGSDVITVSASLATCKELMRRIGAAVTAAMPHVAPKRLQIDVGTHVIIGAAANPRTLRGYGGWVLSRSRAPSGPCRP